MRSEGDLLTGVKAVGRRGHLLEVAEGYTNSYVTFVVISAEAFVCRTMTAIGTKLDKTLNAWKKKDARSTKLRRNEVGLAEVELKHAG